MIPNLKVEVIDPVLCKGAPSKDVFKALDGLVAAGGFYSAEDANSEGKEGLFYVWKRKDIIDHLGEQKGDLFCRFYGISDKGNFEDGFSIPHISLSLKDFARQEGIDPEKLENHLMNAKRHLFTVREKRVHPIKDNKILTSWNGLMIAALSKGYQAMGDKRYADAAMAAADFILTKLRGTDGRLFRRFRHGSVVYPGYLDVYAFLVWGLISSYMRPLLKSIILKRLLP